MILHESTPIPCAAHLFELSAAEWEKIGGEGGSWLALVVGKEMKAGHHRSHSHHDIHDRNASAPWVE